MSVEIHQPEIEALIQQRMASGLFRNVEDVLLYALKSAPIPTSANAEETGKTGSALVVAMQSMPWSDTDIEPSRPHMPVHDIAL